MPVAKCTLKQLRAEAEARGMEGTKEMKRPELVAAVNVSVGGVGLGSGGGTGDGCAGLQGLHRLVDLGCLSGAAGVELFGLNLCWTIGAVDGWVHSRLAGCMLCGRLVKVCRQTQLLILSVNSCGSLPQSVRVGCAICMGADGMACRPLDIGCMVWPAHVCTAVAARYIMLTWGGVSDKHTQGCMQPLQLGSPHSPNQLSLCHSCPRVCVCIEPIEPAWLRCLCALARLLWGAPHLIWAPTFEVLVG